MLGWKGKEAGWLSLFSCLPFSVLASISTPFLSNTFFDELLQFVIYFFIFCEAMDGYLVYDGAMSNLPPQFAMRSLMRFTPARFGNPERMSADHRRLFECELKWTLRPKFLLLIFTLAMEEGVQVSGSFERGLLHFVCKGERSRQSCLR